MVDRYAPRALYLQVADVITKDIESGKYSPGDRLPSESRLCQEYGISRLTARAVHAELRKRGQAVTAQGRGTFVPPQD